MNTINMYNHIFHLHGPIASAHQPLLLYSGGQSASSGIHVSPPSQMDTGGYLPPFLLGSPAAKSVSCQEILTMYISRVL